MFFSGHYHVKPVYEGEGSKYTEFSVTIPPVDKSGTLKLTIQPSEVTPSTSNHDIPTTFDPINPPLQTPWTSYILTILITVCIITIPMAVIAYLNKQQQRKTNATKLS
jgi:hypothetical protein